MPGGGLAVHERLRARVVARRAALDEVAGERERRAREADDAGRAVELAPDEADRLERERTPRAGVERPQSGDVGRRSDRAVDDRADLGLDPQGDAHRLERQHDVGEEDRRVDAELADRHQRDLGAQLGRLGELEDRRTARGASGRRRTSGPPGA